jgi:hypothetical protein
MVGAELTENPQVSFAGTSNAPIQADDLSSRPADPRNQKSGSSHIDSPEVEGAYSVDIYGNAELYALPRVEEKATRQRRVLWALPTLTESLYASW